jgi:transcriptional regulator with XRE-family HTH domain/ribosomal protein L12E/L44/L45/RPP1/RPP2
VQIMGDTGVRNEALHEVLREAGMTYEQLAAAVRIVAAESGDSLRTSKSTVSQWLAGSKMPAPRTAAYIAEALSRRLGREVRPSDLGLGANEDRPQAPLGSDLGPDPVDMLRRLGHDDIHRRTLLANAAYSVAAAALPLGAAQAVEYEERARSPRRAGRAEIDAVRDMTQMFTTIDERHGGQHGRTAVVQYLREDVAALCRATFPSEREQREMLSAAASVAYLCGWKAYDASEHGLAQRYYLQAYALTREAGDELHGAWILRILAHNGMDIRRPEHTLDLAEAALDRVRGKLVPAAEALFVVTRARALANAGRGPEAVAQARQAQDMVVRGEQEEVPSWAALWGIARATVSSHTAKTFRALGDHANAERHYAESARRRPDGTQRITALTVAAEGREQALQGHVEQACDTWGRSLDLLGGVRSARAADEVAGMRRHLRSFEGRGVRAAAVLDERARAWEVAYA